VLILGSEMQPYDTRCYFGVRSKSDNKGQLNLPHGTNMYKKQKGKTEKIG